MRKAFGHAFLCACKSIGMVIVVVLLFVLLPIVGPTYVWILYRQRKKQRREERNVRLTSVADGTRVIDSRGRHFLAFTSSGAAALRFPSPPQPAYVSPSFIAR